MVSWGPLPRHMSSLFYSFSLWRWISHCGLWILHECDRCHRISMTEVMAYGWHLLCRGSKHLQWYLTLYEQPYLMCHIKKQILSFVLLVGGTDSSSCQDPRDLPILLMHSSVLSKSARGQAVCLHAWMMLFKEAQSSVKQRVLMLIPQGLQSLPSHGSQCWNLAIPADALSDAFGTGHPIMHAVCWNSCLEGNIDS